MFATPAIYFQGELGLSPRWLRLLPLNPTHGIIMSFRQALMNETVDLYALALSGAVGAVCLVVGIYYFRRVERGFSDII